MTALLEPTERARAILAEVHPDGWGLFKGRIHMSIDVAVAAVAKALRSAPQEPDDALEQIAEFLVEQRNEPWPGGTDATRLHYWRDKAIEGARRLRALQAPETDYSGIDDG